ncbi:MAG: thioesterase [Treponema sp.]|nr:thioesterase [Treponema sp.]
MHDIIYKQWHDEDLTFNYEFTPSFAQCTPDFNMSWAEIFRITTDMAGEDFTQREMGWEVLKKQGIFFAVSRISYHVIKMPVYHQNVKMITWESAPQGPLATRNFKLVDKETEDVLLYGQTLWTIINFEERKMIPAKVFNMRPTPTIVSEFAGIKPGKIPIPEGMETLGTHKITFSDLDGNGHTNNSKYINFAIDNLPAEFQQKTVKDLRLNYSKEATLGEELEIKGFFNKEENKYTIQGIIDSASSFECELYY